MELMLYRAISAASPLEFLAFLVGMAALVTRVRRDERNPGSKPTVFDHFLAILAVIGVIAGLCLLKEGLNIPCNPYPEGY